MFVVTHVAPLLSNIRFSFSSPHTIVFFLLPFFFFTLFLNDSMKWHFHRQRTRTKTRVKGRAHVECTRVILKEHLLATNLNMHLFSFILIIGMWRCWRKRSIRYFKMEYEHVGRSPNNLTVKWKRLNRKIPSEINNVSLNAVECFSNRIYGKLIVWISYTIRCEVILSKNKNFSKWFCAFDVATKLGFKNKKKQYTHIFISFWTMKPISRHIEYASVVKMFQVVLATLSNI